MYSARARRNTNAARRRATLPTKPTPIEGGMAWVVVVVVSSEIRVVFGTTLHRVTSSRRGELLSIEPRALARGHCLCLTRGFLARVAGLHTTMASRDPGTIPLARGTGTRSSRRSRKSWTCGR